MIKSLLNRLNEADGNIAKVPNITAYFWITKLLTTGMGEVTSDFLFEHLNPLVSAPLSVLIFIGVVLHAQNNAFRVEVKDQRKQADRKKDQYRKADNDPLQIFSGPV